MVCLTPYMYISWFVTMVQPNGTYAESTAWSWEEGFMYSHLGGYMENNTPLPQKNVLYRHTEKASLFSYGESRKAHEV